MIVVCAIHVFVTAKAQESVLASGIWYKLAIDKNGVYKINYDLLRKIGVDVNSINPYHIKIYGNGGGMLPQANNTDRASDLIENAIVVTGEEDGKFNPQDFILFYGEGPDKSSFDLKKNIFFYERNLYDDHNYYFLTISENDGKRLQYNDNAATTANVIDVYDDYVYHELDKFNVLKSGREWFGESIYTDIAFKLDVKGIVNNSSIKVVSDVMAQSYNTGSTFKTFFNSVIVGEQFVSSIPDPSYSPYAAKGLHNRDTLIFNSNTVMASEKNEQEIKYQYFKSAGYAQGYLDYFLVSYKRKLALYKDQTIFLASTSLQNVVSTFEVGQVSDQCTVWEITNPLEPRFQPFSLNDGAGSFTINTSDLHKFIVFNQNLPAPTFVQQIDNQNLHSLSTPNFIIVAYPKFINEAQRLADHRQNHSGITTVVVSTEEIFNEFSSGRKDVCAIRDFTRFLYKKNPSALRSLLLFGKSSYDYKDRVYNNTNFVPTYESRNSLETLETYSSDDFFGFLEDSEGQWGEDPTEDHTLDISVGRIPVKSVEEGQNVVAKIIDYDTNPTTFDSWRKELVFVADDGDNNIHQSQSDKLAQKVESSHPEFNARRIFLDAFTQNSTPAGDFSPDTNKAIQDAIDRGSVIINYTGHGGERIWAQEKIFDDMMINDLDNKAYPLFVTATCEFGRSDDPGIVSGAELAVIKKDGGAIGMVTTARPVNSSTNFELNQAFYDALFIRESNSFLTLGEIFRRTKNNSTSGISNRNFSLLADPSIKLALPEYKVIVNSISNEQGEDSLKALSTIMVKGEIQNITGNKAEDFSGVLKATLFDKENTFTTLGSENPPYTFKQWYNTIFRGAATVTNGNFEFNFIVPKNIAYQVGKGKLSLYASQKTTLQDATGVALDFIIGKSNPYAKSDIAPPTIDLFMGDETFINGGTIKSDSYLVAKLHDESGINISGYSIGNSLIGVLDNKEIFILNDYYAANENDFTNGKIVYKMRGLSPGKHTINVKAWDTYNNSAQATITFMVSDGEGLKIENFGNYPNPFSENTTLYFTHNSPGEDLETIVTLYDLSGQLLKTSEFFITSSSYKVELVELNSNLDFDKKLSPGLYFAKLVVRSVSNGSKSERVAKLIILN